MNSLQYFTSDLTEAPIFKEALYGGAYGLPVGAIVGLNYGLWFNTSGRVFLGQIARGSMMGGGLLAIFRASSAYSAHVRHKNDWVNHLVGGAASGLVFGATKGSMRHAALYSILSGTVGFLASGVFSQHFAMAGLSKEQRKERAPGFFAIPQPDPFAKRIEEMLARKQQ